jgi:hypothetical protein
MRTPARGQQALAFLHEPDGSPYRAGNGAVAGPGEDAAVYQPDARDVQGGAYEAVAVALPGQGGEVRFELTPSPVLLDARRDANGVGVSLVNRGNEPVAATALVSLVGAERGATVVARGSDVQHIPFVIPDWAVRATVDVSMEPAQYSRFTDFGITLFDSTGHQIAVEPMHQAYQRVTADLTKPRRTGRAELALFPGLAEPSSQERWTATVWIRLYADSLRAVDLGPVEMPLDPGATGKASLRMPEAPFTLGDAFHMLGVLAVRVKDQVWQREVPLAPPSPPLAR